MAEAHQDVMTLAHNRHLWKNLVAMLNANPDIQHHSHVNDWLIRGYSQMQAVGIRRQCDSRGKRGTLGFVLPALEASPHVATFSRYDGPAGAWQTFASPGATTIDPARVQTDRAQLAQDTKATLDYVNKVVAHNDPDRRTGPITVTFGNLDGALDSLATLMKKYLPLFRQGAYHPYMTPAMDYGWTNMFTTAWLSDGFQPIDPWSLG